MQLKEGNMWVDWLVIGLWVLVGIACVVNGWLAARSRRRDRSKQ